jgi:osmotically-inducible protein OsmY
MNVRNPSLSVLFVAATLVSGAALVTAGGCASTETKSSTGEYFDDTVLTTKVKAAILNDPDLKVTEINVETFKGVVQLSGFVSSKADIARAVEVARSVEGVQSVKNDMRVK